MSARSQYLLLLLLHCHYTRLPSPVVLSRPVESFVDDTVEIVDGPLGGVRFEVLLARCFYIELGWNAVRMVGISLDPDTAHFDRVGELVG